MTKAETRAPLVISLLLAGMVWMVYGQTLGHQFVSYDDGVYVYENSVVKKGITLHGIGRAFAFGGIGHWHPVTWLSHMLDCDLYGLQPWGHHLTNVLLHAASAILLFLVLRGMTGALWRCAFAAAVFAVHPLHVESVAWIAERKDMLSGLFFMLTLGAYTRYARGPHTLGRFIPVTLLFAVGLMCKDMLVTLPFVLLLLDWWPLGRTEPFPRLVVEKIPLFVLSVISCAITLCVPEKLAAVERMSLPLRLENAAISCAIYLRQMVWPSGLAVPYPNPTDFFPVGEIVLALALLAGITIAAFVCRKTRPWLAVGWLWYLGMLAPVIGIVQISYYAHADRYTYLPQIGLYIAVAWAAAEGFARVPGGQLAAGCVCAIAIAALTLYARTQTSYWKDDETLWTHTLAVVPENAAALNNLGNDYQKKHRVDEAIGYYEKALKNRYALAIAHFNLANALVEKGSVEAAIPQFEKALEIQPDYVDARNNFGNALMQKGHLEEAAAQFRTAIGLEPHFTKAHNNLGIALLKMGRPAEAQEQFQQALELEPDNVETNYNLGSLFLQTGRPGEAVAYFKKALELDPSLAEAAYNLGMIALQQGQWGGALDFFQKAIAADPRSAEAYFGMGNVLIRTGHAGESVSYFQKTVEIAPGNAGYHTNLAVALVQTGRADEAIEHLEKAISLDPGFAKAHSNLGVILLQKNRLDEAAAQFQNAVELQPSLAEGHYNLGLTLERKGQVGEAIPHYKKAVEIQPDYPDAQAALARLQQGAK